MSTPFSRRRAPRSSGLTDPRVARAARFAVEGLEGRRLLSAGSLQFAENVDVPGGATADFTKAVFKQADGKVLVAGLHTGGLGFGGIDLVRFNPNGSLDADFGAGGHATLNVALDPSELAVDPSDGTIYVGGATGAAGSFDFGVAKVTAGGALVTSFGDDGRASVDFFGTDDKLSAMILQTTGAGKRLVLAGSAVDQDPDDAHFFTEFAVARLKLDGTPDAAFGVDGMVTTALGAGTAKFDSSASDVLADGDGLIAGGVAFDGDVKTFTLVRYGFSGGLDSLFGDQGVRRVHVGGEGVNSQIASLANNDGKLLAVGAVTSGTNAGLAMFQGDLATGSPDHNFGDNLSGTFQDPDAPVGAVSAGVGIGGGIVVAGSASDGAHSVTGAVRYVVAPDGTVSRDMSYGGGVAYVRYGDAGRGWTTADARVQADGSLVAAATTEITPDYDLDLTAQSVTAAGVAGPVYTVGFHASNIDFGMAVAIDGQGRSLLAGSTIDGSGVQRGALIRRLANGSPDPSFGDHGVVRFQFGTDGDESLKAVTTDGQDVLVVGDTIDGPVVVRVSSAGAILDVFAAVPGVATESGRPLRLGVDSSGRVIVAGTDGEVDFFVARFHADGTLDASFGDAGVKVIDIETADNGVAAAGHSVDELGGLLVLADGSIVLGGRAAGNHNPGGDFALVKLTPAGVLDTTFGATAVDPIADGVVTADLGADDAITGLALAGGRIVAVGSTDSTTIAVAAFASTGQLESTTVLADLATDDGPAGVGVDAQGRLLIAATTEDRQVLVARLVADGAGYALDAAFGTDGVAVTHYGLFASAAGLAVTPDGSAVVTGVTADFATSVDMVLARFAGDAAVVTPHDPTLDAIGPQSGDEQTQITFTAAGHDVDAGDTLTYSLIGAPAGAAIDANSGVFTWTPTEQQDGAYSFTVRVTDSAGGHADRVVDVTVAEVNARPTLANPGDEVIDEGQTLSFTLGGADADTGSTAANVLTYSVDGPLPAGMTLDAATGAVSWATTEMQDGTYTVTFRVSDNGTPVLSAARTITITVNEVNAAPTLADPGAQSVNEGQGLSFALSGSDPDTGPGAKNVLTYSIVGGFQPGMSIDPVTHAFSWTPTEAQDGTHTVTFRISDNGSPSRSAEQQITITVGEVNAGPTLVSPGNKTVDEGHSLSFPLSASDPDAGPGAKNTLTYSIDTGFQTGMSIDPVTHAFSWTPTEAQDGTYTVTFRVADNGTPSLWADQTITITVGEVNAAPTLGAIVTPQSVNQGGTLSFTATAADVDVIAGQPDGRRFSLIGAPAGAQIDPVSGLFTWAPGHVLVDTYTFTVRVTDTAGLFADQVVDVNVNEFNSAPTLADPGAKTVNEGQPLAFTLVGSDPDVGPGAKNVLTYSIAGGFLPGMALNPNTGAFSWTPAEAQDGPHTVTFRVSDNGSPTLSDERTITITVGEVNQPPTLDLIGPVTGNELTQLSFTAGGHDVDVIAGQADVPHYSLVGGVPAGAGIGATSGVFAWTPGEAQDGTYTVTVRVTDAAGAFTERAVSVVVGEVNAGPTLVSPGTKAINEGQPLAFTLIGSDPDTGPGAKNVLTYSITGGFQTGMSIDPATHAFSWTPTEAQDGTYTVTFRVADNGSPVASATQTITITVAEVNAAPTLDAIASPQAVVAGSPLTFTAIGHDADVVNGSPNALTYSLLNAPAGASINPATGAFAWTPTAAQAGATYTFTVRVTDNGAGALTASQAVTVSVTAPPPPTGPTATVSGGVLTVTGTGGGNTLRVTRANGNYVVAYDASTATFPVASVTRIVINAGDGNDTVIVADNVNAPAEIHGGAGNDRLTGGGGDDMLFGEDGNDSLLGVSGDDVFVGGDGSDVLVGGDGQDVLIGGTGSDYIEGDNGSDILIAGRTAQDASVANLSAIRTIWTGVGSYETRTNTLKTTLLRPASSGGTVTLFDDAATDLLYGGNGTDWFILNLNGSAVDVVLDAAKKELLTDM